MQEAQFAFRVAPGHEKLSIRSYRSTDRAALLEIAADTAHFGEPVEAILEDRRLFQEAFYVYYTDIEPQHAWVACAGERVVGFLAGCLDTRRQQRLWGMILVRVALRALLGRYQLGFRTGRYALGRLRGVLAGEVPEANLKRYPAHLHINIAAPWRGLGLGQGLMEAYLAQLREDGLPGVHLHTTNHNRAACRLYEKVGFELLEERATRIWEAGVTNRLYGMRFA